MKKKSILMAAIAVMLVAVLVVGGTLAYFTDTKSATNTFTVGNVKIDLIESTYHREGNDNSGDKDIPDPTHAASGMKYVTDGHKAFTDDEIKANAKTYADYIGTKGVGMVPGRGVAKCPYVINTGANAAYIRIRVMVPSRANNDYVAVKDGGVITNQWCTGKIDGTRKIVAHARLLAKFQHHVSPFAAGCHAVGFLYGNYVGFYVVDDVGNTCIVGNAVHADTVVNVIAHQSQCAVLGCSSQSKQRQCEPCEKMFHLDCS